METLEAILSARCIPFHVLFDSEYLQEDAPTRFFLDSKAFRKDSRIPKVFGADTNMAGTGTASSFPVGQQKDVQRMSILVDGATDEDEFEVSIILAQGRAWETFKVGNGTSRAVLVERSKPVEGGRNVLRFWGPELFVIDVKAPERLRGRYARLSLHGPLLVAMGA